MTDNTNTLRRMILGGVAVALMTALVVLFILAMQQIPAIKPDFTKVHESSDFTILAMHGAPRAYVIIRNDHRLLIDCPAHLNPDATGDVDLVLLTHHHRDSIEGAGHYPNAKVHAPKLSGEWIDPLNVQKFWKESVPLRNSRTAYFVHPTGIDGITCDLVDGTKIDWQGLSIEVVALPGHSVDHVGFLVNGHLFCGDAITTTGKLWTAYTSEWDHWTDSGLKPAAASVRKMMDERVKQIHPARGSLTNLPQLDLAKAAERIEAVGWHKSYERYTNQQGDVPEYKQLVPKEQVGSGGDKPWSKVSDSLWITGNTYVLKSKDTNGVMVLDPWGQRSVDQVAKLREAEKLGPVELVMFSHAHFDHFDGVYTLPEKGKYAVWALDQVAEPLMEPFKHRAPFLDARPITFDKTLRHGESAKWNEFTFKFHHLPGQTVYTAGIECTIDGKSCLFTADNFFHHTQYSGTGGWMGLNRSSPQLYANSAKLVKQLKPDWVLAEHGGPFEFNAEDFTRRIAWGEAAHKAQSNSGIHGNPLTDWSPHTVTVTPVAVKVKPGEVVPFTIPNPQCGQATILLDGRGVIENQSWNILAQKTDQTVRFNVTVPQDIKPGRHVFVLKVLRAEGEACDPTIVLDVE
jgi:glyoxylase-like metal-dependent hydrolase (beta-lactamase superfamily II)